MDKTHRQANGYGAKALQDVRFLFYSVGICRDQIQRDELYAADGFQSAGRYPVTFQGFDLLPVSTGENANVTYLYKATEQDVHSKAPEKLHSREGHEFWLALSE